MRCNNCGLDYIMDSAQFCPRCNAPLGQPVPPPPQQYQAPPQQAPNQGYQQPPQQQPVQQQYQAPPQQAPVQQQPQYQGQPAPNQGYQAPPQQYQGQPQGGYNQPYYPQPPKPQRVATVRKVDLTDSLIAISSLLLIAAGFDNLWALNFDNAPGAIIVLGVVALIIGVMGMLLLVMPEVLRDLNQFIDILLLVLGVVFAIWGLAALFGDNLGFSGGLVTSGGVGLLFAGLMRMGLVK
ncbi:MAG: hypothetical protein WC375_00730 [Methanomassiliicoccales archaeon]